MKQVPDIQFKGASRVPWLMRSRSIACILHGTGGTQEGAKILSRRGVMECIPAAIESS